MKFKALCIAITAAVVAAFVCAFTVDGDSSIKEITHPFINTYECTRATLGDADLLDNCDHIRIVLGEGDKLELLIKKKGERERRRTGKYSFNEDTRELTADITILGYPFRPRAAIENGRFTVTTQIAAKQLVTIFEAK